MKWNLLIRIKNQDVVLFYKCPCCKFETKTANILRSHKKEKHSDYQETHSWEEPHICDKCGVEFNSEKKFKSHKDEVHNNKSNLISCPLCSYTHNEESNVTKHVADNHKESNSPDINCPICEFKSSSEDIVTKHIEYQHPEKQKCVICPESFSTKVGLNNHTTNVHPVSQDKNKQLNKYQCKNCPENLFGLSALRSHMKETHISCDKCHTYFQTKDDLNKHVSEVHISKLKVKNTLMLGDSMSKYQNPRLIEKAMGGKGLFTPGCVSPRTGRAYCSTRDWPNSHYP